MCKIDDKLKFCTCLEKEDIDIINLHKSLNKFRQNQLPNSNEPFSWIIYEYKESFYSGLEGMLNMPSKEIGFSLTEEFVLSKINNDYCFDFEYEPKEGDNLQINFQRNKYWTEFLSFIYHNEKWEADSYNAFHEIIEPKNYGILKLIK